MSKGESRVNLNTCLLTVLLAVLGFYGERLQKTVDAIVGNVIKYGVKLDQHDSDISGLKADAKDVIHRPEFDRFKAQVLPKGLTVDKPPSPEVSFGKQNN